MSVQTISTCNILTNIQPDTINVSGLFFEKEFQKSKRINMEFPFLNTPIQTVIRRNSHAAY